MCTLRCAVIYVDDVVMVVVVICDGMDVVCLVTAMSLFFAFSFFLRPYISFI